MISQTLLIVLLIAAALLSAFALLCDSPIPFADLVAITAADIIMWSSAVLYASGNVVAEQFVVSQTVVADTVTTYTYQLLQMPVTDIVFASLLFIGAVCLTLYTLYLLIPTITEILEDEVINNV